MLEGAASRGYLQRLAASAMSPVRAIHPVLSPVLANLSFDAETPLSEWPESPEGAESHPEVTRAAPNLRPEAPLFGPAVETDVLHEPLVEPAAPGRRSPHEWPESSADAESHPEVARAAPKSTSEAPSFAPAGEPDTFHEPPVEPAAPRRQSPQEEEGKISVPARAIVPAHPSIGPGHSDPSIARTIVSALGARTDRNETHVEIGPPTEGKTALVDGRPVSINISEGAMRESGGKKERQEFPGHSQAGEIQIHIGRIEVTATPPAAPAIRRPPRKTVRLTEYLKRGRGDS